MNIVILDDYQDVVRHLACFSLLSEHDVRVLTTSYTNNNELAEAIKDAEALVLIRERTPITEALLSKLPHLKIISQTGKAGSHIDLQACTKQHVLVCDGVGSPIAPSELCWALIMAASRHIVPYATNVSNDIWQSSGALGLGRTLSGLTLGIWGYGNIGQRVAGFGNVFGMKILVWGSEVSRAKAKEHGFKTANSKAEFFATSDVLSLHLKLSDATKRCVTQSDLDSMKPDSLFVNISRAELVEKRALYASLKNTPTKRAAIDVFETEPATRENEPLLALKNVLSTPHIGYVEQNNYENYFKMAFENIVAFAQGKPQNGVNHL
ncbi:D-2-hydroxyacid dehydrogenase family protein [Sulfurospirillum halorespirans]|uniref:Phosphoglycerate dehydrogenase-like protein n=1 Tax=Sulfurospirillum halorespirans DSM 13726 TaxID=1193502 RepID=A0A1D7TNM1_9BACT|nr:D-2-hydroxyacid dehydrogenase family protein [Sulfurospirillum halorespirans]AOO66572.1 phosphoglycerate dehydrogenase-like protein [Sulfurospirillum halorespirans DSM 13726]